MAQNILLVDDEAQIREILRLYLQKDGFGVLEAADGKTAVQMVREQKPDLVLLDLMLPVLDGLQACREIRSFSDIPIIMLTAKAEDEERILGLELGADDYVVKPFSPREVAARVKAVLRRVPNADFRQAKRLEFSDLLLDVEARKVISFGEVQELTAKETELLYLLASHAGHNFSREELLEKIWGYEYGGETRTVDNHIKRLRHKLGNHEEAKWRICTVWGVGYRFEADL